MSDTIETSAVQVSEHQLHDLIAWHERDGTKKGVLTTAALRELLSARTSTAPVAWAAAYVPGENVFRDKQTAMDASPTNEAIPLYASPPPPQPGVRVTEALRNMLDHIDIAKARIEREPHVAAAQRERTLENVEAIARAALTASIPDSGEKAVSSIDYWQRRGHEPTAFELMAIAGKEAVYKYRDRPDETAGRVYDAVLAAAPTPPASP